MRKRITPLLLAVFLLANQQARAYGTPERDYITVMDSVEAKVPLEGELIENLRIISVVMPASVDIVVRIHNDGRFRQLFAPTLLRVTSRSDMEVDISLVGVADGENKLAAFDATLNTYSTDGRNTLIYDGSAAPLSAGPCDILLGRLAPLPADGNIVPANQFRLSLEGKANAANGVVGREGDTFSFSTTLKVAAVQGG